MLPLSEPSFEHPSSRRTWVKQLALKLFSSLAIMLTESMVRSGSNPFTDGHSSYHPTSHLKSRTKLTHRDKFNTKGTVGENKYIYRATGDQRRPISSITLSVETAHIAKLYVPLHPLTESSQVTILQYCHHYQSIHH